MNQIPLLVVGAMSVPVQGVFDRISKTQIFQIMPTRDLGGALKVAPGLARAVMVISLDSVQNLNLLLSYLKENEPKIKSGKQQILILYQANTLPAIGKLRQGGCLDVLAEPVHEKMVVMRLDQALGLLFQGETSPYGKNPLRLSEDAAPAPKAGAKRSRIIQSPPLTLTSDQWLSLGGGAKKIGEKWVIRLTGPGPVAGHFDGFPDLTLLNLSDPWLVEFIARGKTAGESAWVWEPQDSGRKFIKDEGRWLFFGEAQPQFEDKLWWFSGVMPVLCFVRPDGKVSGYRFRVDATDTLSVTKDSKSALSMQDAIRRTFEVAPSLGGVPKVSTPTTELPTELTPREATPAPAAPKLTEKQTGPIAAPPKPAPPPVAYKEPAPRLALDLAPHPLVVALFTAELIRKGSVAPDEMAARYCEFLSKSLGHIQVELWKLLGSGEWKCLGTQDRKPPKLEFSVKTGGAEAKTPVPVRVSDWVASPDGSRLGKLALSAEGAEGLTEELLSAFSQASVGILRTV